MLLYILLLLDGRPEAAAPVTLRRALDALLALGLERDARASGRRDRRGAGAVSAVLDAFLEMMAAERGAARHTLDAYRRDLADFRGVPRPARRGSCRRPAPTTFGPISPHLADAGLRPVDHGAGASRRSGSIYRFLFLEGRRGGRSDRADRPAQAGPAPAQAARRVEEIEALIAAARGQGRPGRPAARGSAGAVLRHRPAGQRAGRAAAVGAGAGPDRAHRARQGRQGAHGADRRRRRARRWPPGSACGRSTSPSRSRQRWLFPSRGRSGHLTRQRVGPAAEGAGAGGRPRRRRACRRTCCATPSPATWSPTAPTCARCRRCLVTPTSPRRRSIPMSRPSGWPRWWRSTIRWPGSPSRSLRSPDKGDTA